MQWLHYPVGFLDEMLSVFDDHNHPVVLIGRQALCWMAVCLETGQDLDLLVRASQQDDILQCLLASGCWIAVDHKKPDYGEPTPTVPRLKRLGQDFHIILWSEDLYYLKVDGELCEVPHICAWNAVLAEPRFYHPPPPRVRPHHVLPNPGVQCVPSKPDQTPPPGRPKQTPIFIPTIPRYISACFARIISDEIHPYTFPICTIPHHDLSYLIRYLFLEMGAQRAKLLPMLPEEHRKRMEQMLDGYIRTVKANFGWETRKPSLERMKERKEQRVYPLSSGCFCHFSDQ